LKRGASEKRIERRRKGKREEERVIRILETEAAEGGERESISQFQFHGTSLCSLSLVKEKALKLPGRADRFPNMVFATALPPLE